MDEKVIIFYLVMVYYYWYCANYKDLSYVTSEGAYLGHMLYCSK